MAQIDYIFLQKFIWHSIFILIISLFLFLIIIKYSNRLIKIDKIQIQNIHSGNISRLGGLVIFLVCSSYIFFYLKELNHLILFSLIIITPAILEDLMVEIKPIIRLICILFGSFLIIYNIEYLPFFDFKFNYIFNNYHFKLIFFTIALTAVINGQNIIDGTNGLSALSGLSIFSSLLYLGVLVEDYQVINISIIFITLLFSFLLFNYPFGRIFLGDSGSYFTGLVAGYVTIYLFGKYDFLPTWTAAIILYYPSQEVIFSYFRKILTNKSPFMADNNHLHLKVYYLLSNNMIKRPQLYNSLVAPFLSMLWVTPLALVPFSIQNNFVSFIGLIMMAIIYFCIFFALPNPKTNNNTKKVN